MSHCWARSLGDCQGGISREHYISAVVLGEGPVTVSGLPWCQEQSKELPPAALVGNILCRHHNAALSVVDAAGGHAWRELATFSESARAAAQVPRRARPKSLTKQRIDGIFFERWLLKTAINLATCSPECPRGWEPPPEAVNIAFARAEFSTGSGMYWRAQDSKLPPRSQHGLKVQVLTAGSPREFCGARLLLNNWDFTVSTKPLEGGALIHRPKLLRLQHRRKNFRLLRFDWSASEGRHA